MPINCNRGQISPLCRPTSLYVLDDGTVRLTFIQAKQTLNMMRELAASHDKALVNLCRLFDNNTKEGQDMSHYDNLTSKILQSIAYTFNRRVRDGITNGGRGAILPLQNNIPQENSEDY